MTITNDPFARNSMNQALELNKLSKVSSVQINIFFSVKSVKENTRQSNHQFHSNKIRSITMRCIITSKPKAREH